MDILRFSLTQKVLLVMHCFAILPIHGILLILCSIIMLLSEEKGKKKTKPNCNIATLSLILTHTSFFFHSVLSDEKLVCLR